MAPPAVLMVGTGEYTTGFVSGAASTSDKKVGVVGLTCKCVSSLVRRALHTITVIAACLSTAKNAEPLTHRVLGIEEILWGDENVRIEPE
jgi:hypothetical protein